MEYFIHSNPLDVTHRCGSAWVAGKRRSSGTCALAALCVRLICSGSESVSSNLRVTKQNRVALFVSPLFSLPSSFPCVLLECLRGQPCWIRQWGQRLTSNSVPPNKMTCHGRWSVLQISWIYFTFNPGRNTKNTSGEKGKRLISGTCCQSHAILANQISSPQADWVGDNTMFAIRRVVYGNSLVPGGSTENSLVLVLQSGKVVQF